MVKFFLIIFGLCFYNISVAQENTQSAPPWSGFGIETIAMGGKVFKHEEKFRLPIPKLSTGLDVDLILHTYGKRPWEQRRKYPTIGLGITYTDYGIDSVYGRCISMYPNIILPIVTGKSLEWTLRIGDGIGYVTKRYSRVNPVDTINGAIGSHLNDFAMFSSDLRYHVNEHWDIQIGGHFTHISDASYHKPNLGVNLYGAHIGVRYFPVTSRPKHMVRELQPLKNRWLAQVRLSMAYVSSEAPNGPLYPVYIASGYMSKRWLSKNKAFAGLDYSYHEDIYAFLRNNQIYPGTESQHSYKSAVFFGNEFLMGRIGVVLQIGVYLAQSALKQDPYYEKIGGHYYIVQKERGPIKEFFLSAFLKTHKTIAELGEFGLGFGF
jgi:hypothetical protein